MHAVLEHCPVKNGLPGGKQTVTTVGQEEKRFDRGAPGWLPCRLPDTNKRGVLELRVMDWVPGYEPVLETLLINSVVRRQKN